MSLHTTIIARCKHHAGQGACGLFLLAALGCGDSQVQVYRIAKEEEPSIPPAMLSSALPDSVPLPQSGSEVNWSVPSGWEEQPASGFRKGSFLLKGPEGTRADVSVTSFPEAAGGVLANINRWRAQIGLPAIAEDQLKTTSTRLEVGGQTLFFVDLFNEQPTASGGTENDRILGGILPLRGETWFFKMKGTASLLEKQQDNFHQFLKSLKISPSSSTPVTPADGRNTSTTPAREPAALISLPELPDNWSLKQLSPMRVASIRIAGENGMEADLAIVPIPGDGGGRLENINRWRKQLELAPVQEEETGQLYTFIEGKKEKVFTVVDFVSEKPLGERAVKTRILAAIAEHDGSTWFFKMVGEEQLLGNQKAVFLDFLREFVFP